MRYQYRLHGILLVVLAAAVVAGAQTRTWSLSRDTVYEWASQGDSARIVNSGTDTLAFDSVALELVRPSGEEYEVLFDFAQVGVNISTLYLRYASTGGRVYPPPGPKNWRIAGGSGVPLKNFRGNHRLLITAKRADIVQNDTVVTRLIFMASAGRGRDTLVFYSRQDGPSSIWGGPVRPRSTLSGGRVFDLRGRRAEATTKGIRVPLRALKTERE